jgi:hypothetical protein
VDAPPPVAPDLERSYAPGWLPPGFQERRRSVVSDPMLPGIRAVRVWSKEPLGTGGRDLGRVPSLIMALVPGRPSVDGVPVQVGGVTGWYRGPDAQSGNQAVLAWPVEGDQSVYIQSNAVTAKADLLRVANSAHLDKTPLRQPLTVGWAPFAVREYSFGYGGDRAGDWSATLNLGGPIIPADSLSVTVGTDPDVPEGGTEVRVGRATGRFVVDEQSTEHNPRQCVVLPLPSGGRTLAVCSYINGPGGARMPQEQLLRAAASVDTTMRADTAWIR